MITLRLCIGGGKKNVIIICRKHGKFRQLASNHLLGQGCPKCGIERGIKIHSNYAWKRANRKIPTKNELQKLLKANDNNACSLARKLSCTYQMIRGLMKLYKLSTRGTGWNRLSAQEIINRIKIKYRGRIDNSKIQYLPNKRAAIVTCKKHKNKFEIKWDSGSLIGSCHLGSCIPRFTNKQFVDKAILVHNHTYDYSKSDYKNTFTKIIITCLIHGDFLQTPTSHLDGAGCSKCGREKVGHCSALRAWKKSRFKKRPTKNEFERIFKKFNGNGAAIARYFGVSSSSIRVVSSSYGFLLRTASEAYKETAKIKPVNMTTIRFQKELKKIMKTNSVIQEQPVPTIRSSSWDFFILPNIVIEIDGWRHRQPIQKARDERKDTVAKKLGIRVIHLDSDCLKTDEQCKAQINKFVVPYLPAYLLA